VTLSVFLDANVLVPVGLTDLLLRLAEKGLIDPHWSPQVLDEVARAVARRQPDRPPEAMRRRFDAMNRAFPYASTEASGENIEAFELPDPDDRHVAAAAKACEAQVVVTHNTKDFPAAELAAHGLSALPPDDLLLGLFHGDAKSAAAVVREAAAATRNPPMTVADILVSLSKVHLPKFVAAVTAYLESEPVPSDAAESDQVPPEI
jgi:predicted nucleic acid-binding protein